MRLALTYDDPGVARELVDATLGMIGGQYLDITGDDDDLAELHRLKTGRLFAASVGLGLRVAGVADEDRGPWRASVPTSGCCSRSLTTSWTRTESPRDFRLTR